MSDQTDEVFHALANVDPLGEPVQLWNHFLNITKIPRCSKHEDRIREFIVKYSASLKLRCDVDAAGNVLVKKPATPGKENSPVLILQGHIDMVCEKNEEVQHDFSKDPLKLRVKGDYLYATDTTLGADNGIGAAAMLAIMENTSISHGPLEFLFTIDEETGLTGAFQLQTEFLVGRRMLNLDTEEEGAIYVGCAGGGDSKVFLPLESENAVESAGIKINVTGLLGGHSGVDIHLGRANSNVLLARTLKAISKQVDYLLVDITGGTKRNAIPRQSSALLLVKPGTDISLLEQTVANSLEGFRNEFTVESNIIVEAIKSDIPIERCFNAASTKKAVDLLLSLPNGVQAMCQDIPDLVETSTNLAIISIHNDRLTVELNSRTSVESALEWALDHIKSISSLSRARFKKGGSYPGWKPDISSSLLETLKTTHRDVLGTIPEIKAIHAGLETGIIGEKFPGMDMVSLGPQIEHPHSPEERVKISSTADFWKLLIAALERL